MTASLPVPGPQSIILGIKNLMESDPLINQLAIYPIPHYERSTTVNHPIAHVFAVTRDVADFSSGQRYESNMRVAILIMLPQPDQNSVDRVIHRYEEAIEDLLIRNFQMSAQKDAGIIPANMAIEMVSLIGSDYRIRDEEEQVVDVLMLDVNVLYVRIVS